MSLPYRPHADARPVARMSIASSHPRDEYPMAHEILPGSAAHSVFCAWRKYKPPPAFYDPNLHLPHVISTTVIPSDVQKRMELATALRKRQATADYPEFHKRHASNYADVLSSTPATVRRPAYADVLASSFGAYNNKYSSQYT